MSYNPRTLAQPTRYTRQTSFDDYPSAANAGESSARYGGGASSASNMNRRPTVRGAVRGTVREAGSRDPRLSSLPPGGATGGMGRALTRGKTLTRPDRFVAPAPLINPGLHGGKTAGGTVQTTLVNGQPTLITSEPWWDPWTLFVEVSTFWAPRWLLRRCGMRDEIKMRAWKEKCALCTISGVLMGVIGFITIGLNRTLCPSDATSRFRRMGSNSGESEQRSESEEAADGLYATQDSSGSTDGPSTSRRKLLRPSSGQQLPREARTSRVCLTAQRFAIPAVKVSRARLRPPIFARARISSPPTRPALSLPLPLPCTLRSTSPTLRNKSASTGISLPTSPITSSSMATFSTLLPTCSPILILSATTR